MDESSRLALDLHGALSEIDPARWHEGAADAMRARLAAIRERAAALIEERWPERAAPLRARLAELGERLAMDVPVAGDVASGQTGWMAFRQSMVPSYEALHAALRALEIHVPSLRPTNYKRNVVHVLSAMVALSILYVVPETWWTIAITTPLVLWAWSAETLRRVSPRVNAALMRVFDPIAHPHEHRRVNSATWYSSALFLLSLVQAPLPSAVGLAVLGLGDPAAALVGRRFGRVRLMHGRTLEGALAFVAAGMLGGTLVALAFAPALPLFAIFAIAGAGAIAGAVAELVSLRIDDNLSVPLCAAAAAWLAQLAVM